MKNIDFKFPLDNFEELLINIGWQSIDDWIKFWDQYEELFSISSEFYGEKYKKDWFWGAVLPLLSNAYYLKKFSAKRNVLGLSALPGTGKTTLGLLIEKISTYLDLKVSVVSLDDFYLPSNEMEKAIKGNPWEVSRGFPGTHSVELMEDKILDWKLTGKLNIPIFDKSLRSGLGDRAYWKTEYPDLLILEGWFLGVNTTRSSHLINQDIQPFLNNHEVKYRLKIQDNLNKYKNIWKLIDKIWQIKPCKFLYMNEWKRKQEKEMLRTKGNALVDKNLKNFIRMLNTSIPQKCFDEINSNYLLIINKNRTLISVGLNK